VGLLIVLAFIVIALFAPYLSPYPKDATGKAMSLEAKLKQPSLTHPMGTDDLGRDMLSRIFYGTRLSLGLGMAVVVVTASLGTVMGCIAGYFGGKIDEIIMRIGDILMAIPYMLLVIALVVATGRGLDKLVMAISLPWWPWYARVVRGEVVRIRETTFVDAARALGASNRRLIFVHILPNVLNVIIVQASLQIGRAILAVAAMGFLGLGVQPPQVEWGLLVSIGRTYMPTWWWMASFPGAAIFLLGLGFNFLGDGLRDILDPRGLT
jgi:peptide/nickel transport system permease protein